MMDTGLVALSVIAAYYKIPISLPQLERAYIFEAGNIDSTTIVRAAIDLKLKARVYSNISKEELERMVFPAIIRMDSNNYIVITGIRDGRYFIVDPAYRMEPLEADKEKVLADWSGEVILFTRRYDVDESDKEFGFSWFMPVIIKYVKYIRNVFFISIILQLLGLASPIFMQLIIDKVLVHHSVNTLDILVIGMIIAQLFSIWMASLRIYIFNNIAIKMDVVLSSQLFKNITRLPIKYFNKWQAGDVVSRVGELENLRNFITNSSLTIVLDIIFSVVYIAIMLYYSTILSVVVVVIIPLFALLNLVIAPIYKERLNNKFIIASKAKSFLIETITGIQTVKANAIERKFIQVYEDILAKYVQTVFSVISLANIANCISMLLQQVFNLSILWIGSLYVMDGDISVGELVAFQMMSGYLIIPIMRLVSQWQYFQQTRVSMERLADVMNEKTEPVFNPTRTTLPDLRGEIIFDNISFRYDNDDKNVLDNIRIRISAGMKIGIAGKSGSGKSTLTKLIQRLYVPSNGRILIDGVDIAQVEAAWLRRQIGVVLQDSMLFSGTIEENIKIACPNADMNDVVKAAKLAGADMFINELPNKYETFVGERGSLLSGGQRQRIAIARALISNPRIIIFDEATSALDCESERIIMDNMEKISKGRTMIIIAHRLLTIEKCNAILFMDKGRIVEGGTHHELMNRNGMYRSMYMAQYGV